MQLADYWTSNPIQVLLDLVLLMLLSIASGGALALITDGVMRLNAFVLNEIASVETAYPNRDDLLGLLGYGITLSFVVLVIILIPPLKKAA